MTDQRSAVDICIIGAGSSGIAVAKALHDKGIRFDIYEKGSSIGGMWRYGNDNGLSCAYRSLHIDTSRNNLGYSDFSDSRPTNPISSRIGSCSPISKPMLTACRCPTPVFKLQLRSHG